MAKEILCVLGMHRSGTSLLCEILHHMGITFGTKEALIEGNHANPDGYFELKELAELMRDIYTDAGLMTMSPVWLDLNTIPQSKKKWYCGRIEQCLRTTLEQCPDNQIFAIKHPRICIILPWLKECFEKMNVRVRYISIIRNPLETAQSLLKRDCYPIDFGLHLWEKHNAAILAYANLSDTLFLSHQMLFDNFDTIYTKIADFIHMTEDVYSKTKAVINPNYRHHELNWASYDGNEDLHFPKDFYETLLDFCMTDDLTAMKTTAAEKLEQYFKEDKIFREANAEYLEFCRRRINDAERPMLKNKIYYNFLLRWMEEKAAGNSIEKCLIKKNIKTIALYGVGKIGRLVYEELKESSIHVICLIDRNPDSASDWSDVPLAKPEETEKYATATAILVTSIASYHDIRNSLKQNNVINLNSLW